MDHANPQAPSRSQEFLDLVAFGSMLVFASVMPPLTTSADPAGGAVVATRSRADGPRGHIHAASQPPGDCGEEPAA